MKHRIILIGAPSGAGKTTLSKQLIENGFARRNHDFKALPSEFADGDIVEIGTNKWGRTVSSRNWHHLLSQLDDFETIYCIHLRVSSRRELAKRYLGRLIFEYPKKHLLKPRAWLHGLGYLLTGKLVQSEQVWISFEYFLNGRHPGKVISAEQAT